MSKRAIAAAALGAVLTCTVVAQAQEKTSLPLHKVRLYETGVGYFERSGLLPAGGAGLPVPASHLDDALKTLIVLDADGASTVSGIAFPSSMSPELGRVLAGLPEGSGEPLSLQRLVETLEGAAVEVRLGREVVRGRLVDVVDGEASGVERCVPGTVGPEQPCTLRKEATLVVVGEDGTLRRLVLADVASVRPLDDGTRARLGAALDAVVAGGARARRWLEVAATGGRSVSLGYVAEAPVWRSTYRLVLAPANEASLQGWALVHNDTDEDWRRVRLELVNGQPDSFLFPLAAPRYARRELVTPDVQLSTVPQLLDQTADGMWWGDQIGESYGAGGLGLSGTGEGGGGRGEGIGLGSIGTLGHGAGSGGASDVVTVGNLSHLAPAEGVESGSLFTYSIGTPLDLPARSSAIVPFYAGALKVERIAWFDEPGAVARAAVHVVNTTPQTLPAGTIAVFADGGFAGESMLVRTKPREERILRFGSDLDVELEELDRAVTRSPRAVALALGAGALREHFVERRVLKYSLVNRSATARLVYLDLDYQDNARITGADRLEYDDERSKALAAFTVAPHASLEKTLVVELGRYEDHALATLTPKGLDGLAASDSLPAATRRTLRDLAARHRELGAVGEQTVTLRARQRELGADLERLRESLQVLVGAKAKATRRLAARLERIEAELESLATAQRAARVERARLRRELERLYGALATEA